ncbi:MAG: SRPBCC family protein [Gammaproteobacteria bacterium]
MPTLLSQGAVALLAGSALCVHAANLESVRVDAEGKRYSVRSVVTIDAPVEAVYAVLADYDQFERVSSIFKESRYLEQHEDGSGVVFTQMHDCILFFCKTINRTETIDVSPPSAITTQVLPEQSDVAFGVSKWTLLESSGTTRVTFDMQMEPKFWIPPVVGPYFIRRFLKGGTEEAAQRLENFALELAADEP